MKLVTQLSIAPLIHDVWLPIYWLTVNSHIMYNSVSISSGISDYVMMEELKRN